jgi:hypothetical protein
VSAEIRRLIYDMSLANPLWGAPRIHGELLKLGIEIGQTSVAKYMARRRRPPSQGWRRDEAAIDAHWNGPSIARIREEGAGMELKISGTRCTLQE